MIIKQSMLTMRILLDKDNRGSIDDNSCNSNECNECNECISNEYNECYECNSNECNKTPDHELSNKKFQMIIAKTIAGLIRIT